MNLVGCTLLIALVLAASSCKPAGPSVGDELFVRLDIGGFAPTTLMVSEEGTVSYNHSDRFTREENVSRILVAADEILELKAIIIEGDFFSLEHEYTERLVTDAVPYKVSVTLGNASHAIFCANRLACPPAAMATINGVKDLWPERIVERGFG